MGGKEGVKASESPALCFSNTRPSLPLSQSIATTASQTHDLIAVTIVHRVGTVPVGDASVIIAASSPHRSDALAAVAWAIDELKARVPIWKKELSVGGGVWKENAEARALVEAARKRGEVS